MERNLMQPTLFDIEEKAVAPKTNAKSANADMMTTKEIADFLGTSPKVVLENSRKAFPKKIIRNGVETLWSKQEVTVLVELMKRNSSNHASDLYFQSKGGAKTELTPVFKMQQAFLMYKEAAEELLTQKDGVIAAQGEKIAIDAPKVEFYDEYADAGQNVNISTAAKMLGISPQQKFFKWLLAKQYVYKKYGNDYEPYEQYSRRGIFGLKAGVSRGDRPFATRTTMITPKGLQYFAGKAKEILGKLE